MAQLPEYVLPGDLLFEEGTGWIAWSIKKLTKSKFSHVAIVVDRDTVIEAWPGGVRLIPCPYNPGDYEIKRRNDLTMTQRKSIVAYAKKFIGMPYDYGRIIALLLELILHIHNRFFTKDHIICSVFAAWSYWYGGSARLRPDLLFRHITPEDLYEDKELQDAA